MNGFLISGLRLEPGKRYSTVVDKSFHVSMAALDCSSVSKPGKLIHTYNHCLRGSFTTFNKIMPD